MEFKQFIFYFFAAVLVFAATMVITVKNPVKAALFLVLAFFNAAGLWLLLQAEFLAIEMVLVLGSGRFGLERVPEPAGLAADASNTRALGRLLYTTYAYPFELAALVLLVAIIAAIALTLRRRKDTKYQDPGRQVRV